MGSKKRKQYLVDKNFQFRIIGAFLGAVILALIIFTALTAGYFWIQGMAGDNVFKEYITIFRQTTEVREILEDGEYIQRELPATEEIPGVKRWEIVVPPLLFNNLVILLAIAVIGIFSSHRIAGPLYRIQKDIARALNGEGNVRVKIRKKDKLGGLADQVNMLLGELDRLKGERNELL